MNKVFIWSLFSLFISAFSLWGQQDQPEAETGYREKKAAYGKTMMAASANPYATREGLEILRRGGNALDAAIAMQMVLNVVEPQSSGIGGGAFLLYYNQKEGRVMAYDGRETAPEAVHEKWFLDSEGAPLAFSKILVSGRSVGVPGVLKMLELAHQQLGKLPWEELFSRAIQLANQGFPISPRLHQLIKKNSNLNISSAAGAYLFRDGEAKEVGSTLLNRELGETLTLLAQGGTQPFYSGTIAAEIVAVVQKNGVF